MDKKNENNDTAQANASTMNSDYVNSDYVKWFRGTSPYVRSHRGRTFVVYVPGEAFAGHHHLALLQDIALLQSLGVRIVLVHGARPQIDEALQAQSLHTDIVDGIRPTSEDALPHALQATLAVKLSIEAELSLGVSLAGDVPRSRLMVRSGNYISARPLGVRGGTDYGMTGVVRKIEVGALQQDLNEDGIVLVSPIGYAPGGGTFNLLSRELAAEIATALGADKLILLDAHDCLRNEEGTRLSELLPGEAEAVTREPHIPAELQAPMSALIRAARGGVNRAHLIGFADDGALLKELFTREGCGTQIAEESYERIRQATVEDLDGILTLIRPLEAAGKLLPRSSAQLEQEIDQFIVADLDGLIIGCAALYHHASDSCGELGCFVTHPDYRAHLPVTGHDPRNRRTIGELLLREIRNRARRAGYQQLIALTTEATHWFLEHGFSEADLDALPQSRRDQYNAQRKSKIVAMRLDASHG